MSIDAMKQALEFIKATNKSSSFWLVPESNLNKTVTALRLAIEQAERQETRAIRIPKEGDRVICIEDESVGTVWWTAAGGGPYIKFDDGSYGQWSLREFGELFRYEAPPQQEKQENTQ